MDNAFNIYFMWPLPYAYCGPLSANAQCKSRMGDPGREARRQPANFSRRCRNGRMEYLIPIHFSLNKLVLLKDFGWVQRRPAPLSRELGASAHILFIAILLSHRLPSDCLLSDRSWSRSRFYLPGRADVSQEYGLVDEDYDGHGRGYGWHEDGRAHARARWVRAAPGDGWHLQSGENRDESA